MTTHTGLSQVLMRGLTCCRRQGYEIGKRTAKGEKKYLEISPDVYEKFVLAKIVTDTDNSKTIETGLVKTLWGLDIFVSNNIVKSRCFLLLSKDKESHCLCRNKSTRAK